MANEVTMSVALSASKNGAIVNPGAKTKLLTMSGSNMLQNTVSVGTSSQLLSLGDISGAPSAIMITNLDSTNYVLISGETGFTAVMQIKILAGETILITPLAATFYAKSDTAACLIQIVAVEA